MTYYTSIEKIEWTAKHRNKIISEIKEKNFDVLIIGGGITGAGIFRDLCMRNTEYNKGLNILLIEMRDFAFGTSNRSTKLAHGGLRYLAYGEFDLVREAEHERDWLRENFQNLVRPLAFIYCAFKKFESKGTIKMALSMYDQLADYKNYKNFKWLSQEELAELEPALDLEKTSGKGAGLYYDTNINDARLTLETIKEGIYYGGTALNYIKANSLIHNESGKVSGANVTDVLTNESFNIKAKIIINATGEWVDFFLKDRKDKIIRPTKGVHIVVPRENIGNNNAVIIRNIEDKRHFFAIPRGKFTLIGTTDTDYDGTFEEVYCTQEECDYMTRSIKYYFPKAKVDNNDIISSYAGLRPLIREEGKSESEVSRKHLILKSDNGLWTISGGKLTIFRKMAEDLAEKLISHGLIDIPFVPEFTKKSYLIGYNRNEWENDKSKFNMDEDILDYLYQEYGKGIYEIMEIIKNNPDLKQRLIEDRPFIMGEIKYILEHEFAPKLIDVLYRRTEVWMLIHPKFQPEVAEKVANLMASYYGWDEETKKKEIDEYLTEIYKNSFFYKPEN